MVDKRDESGENIYVSEKQAKTILIVEDEDLLSEMYKEVFEAEGYYTHIATSGKEALETVQKSKPDFILLDILLPGENGIYFLEQVKKNPTLAAIPVIAFSNFDDPQIKKDAKRLGAADYLIKTNYTPQEVVQKVKKLVR